MIYKNAVEFWFGDKLMVRRNVRDQSDKLIQNVAYALAKYAFRWLYNRKHIYHFGPILKW